MRMQVDMFAVELGAAVLLQFDTDVGVVRVLADAGRAKHNVNQRLGPAAQAFGADFSRIDLLIGTHYDADHLDGLVDIIKNSKVSIGEAWLPPVANDTQLHALSDAPDDSDLLALQFANDEGNQVLATYLREKAHVCNQLMKIEREAGEHHDTSREVMSELSGDHIIESLQEGLDFEADDTERTSRIDKFFLWHMKDASRTAGINITGHGDEQIVDPWGLDELTDFPLNRFAWHPSDLSRSREASAFYYGALAPEVLTLSMIRRSTAAHAINAKSLAAVVNALKAKGVDIRCATIPDGKPRRFYWSSSKRRFSPSKASASAGPELLLLGPSESLVKKHWSRLPIGNYLAMASNSSLPIKPITASNQLSYIMTFEHAEQRILISGDAGCVDFKPGAFKPYYPKLINALSPLHIVQVAHHAGNNSHFYRCLLESDFLKQDDLSYLLLSHATKDKKRPSDVFGKFVEQLRKDETQIQLLFTSTPIEHKVRDFKELIAAATIPPSESGDVRLSFDGAWSVANHAVQVP